MRLDPVSVSALAAIFGSLTGALTSSVSAWITQRHQNRRDLLAKRVFHREQLYSDFISESARAMPMPSSMISRTQLSSRQPMHS